MFALVDCNNFYVSCERAFQPKYEERPVIVLSNNDGCVISRSIEAKKLGVGMTVPHYKLKADIAKHGIKVFSSNYSLYGNLSGRVMKTLELFSPEVYVYSIDEAFLFFKDLNIGDLYQHGRTITTTVKQWTGIPVCVGFAPTRTLAKLANHIAKAHPESGGVFVFDNRAVIDDWLKQTPVAEVWGIGRRSAEKLRSVAIRSAYDLSRAPESQLRQILGVNGLRVAAELKGINAVSEGDEPAANQSVSSSRSFGTRVTDLADMEEAVASFTAIATGKLRRKQLYASALTVYVRTNPNNQRIRPYSNSITVGLDQATNDTATLLNVATKSLHKVYKEGYIYQKAGIILSDLVAFSQIQPSLFTATKTGESEVLTNMIDLINKKMGNGTLFHAAEGIKKKWQMKREMCSPHYTTRWSDILKIEQ